MGRFLKSAAPLGTTTAQAVSIAKGNANSRPANPKAGDMRFNTDVNAIEVFNGTEFQFQASGGEVALQIDDFTGDGLTTTFTMAAEPSHAKQILVFIGSVYQDYVTAYTINQDEITFTSAPPNGETIKVIHHLASTDTVNNSM
jgi:hypothetical protein